MMHGSGIYNWPDGKKYDGGYENNRKCGFGTYTYADQTTYVGNFHNGRQHGKGHRKGRDGIWVRGKYNENLVELPENERVTKEGEPDE